MAINSNSNTQTIKLFIAQDKYTGLTSALCDNGFDSTGTWIGGGTAPREDQYIDIGFVNDERTELTIGGIPISLPGTGADQSFNWAIMGKVLRLTISGTIPDGIYKGTGLSASGKLINGKSNSSVFRYKMSRLLAFSNALTGSGITSVLSINNVYYRPRYMGDTTGTLPPTWIVSSFSYGFVEGSRIIKYTMTLDMGNNGTGIRDSIDTKYFGDI